MTYQPIECELYDYIEIACLRAYKLEINLLTGETIHAIAKDTRVIEKQEFLVVDNNGKPQEIRLDKIKTITALDKTAEFTTIKIN